MRFRTCGLPSSVTPVDGVNGRMMRVEGKKGRNGEGKEGVREKKEGPE